METNVCGTLVEETMVGIAAWAACTGVPGRSREHVDLRFVGKLPAEDVAVFCNHTDTGRNILYIRPMRVST